MMKEDLTKKEENIAEKEEKLKEELIKKDEIIAKKDEEIKKLLLAGGNKLLKTCY